jgi:NADPH-dependent curcumin reductase CurA
VEAVGADVTRFQPGDEVFGVCKGTFAEYAPAAENKLVPKPANLTFEQAAVVAISGSTALQGLRDQGKVRPGQKVLIIGASGWRGDLRRAAGQGVRGRGHRRVQHDQGGPGSFPGCRQCRAGRVFC